MRILILIIALSGSARAAESNRAAADAHYKAGIELLKQKKVPLAVQELKDAIAAQPQHAPAHRTLGLAYVMLNQNAKAIEEFETFIQLVPHDLNTSAMREYVAEYYKSMRSKQPCAPSSLFDASPGR